MAARVGHNGAWAAAAKRSLPGILCRRQALPVASIALLSLLPFSLPHSTRSPILLPRRAPGNFTRLTSLICRPLSSSVFSLNSKSVPISGFRMSKAGTSAAPNFSSSVSTIGPTPEAVIEFWFNDIDPEKEVYSTKEWFKGGPEFDIKCEKNCGESLKLAITGALDGWLATGRGRLALVILLDQITRNIYRNSPLSFAQDETAIKIALETVEKGLHKELAVWERRFLYMPLMHSENLRDHETVDRLFRELVDESSDKEMLKKDMLFTLEFERKHHAVIKKFGRYPTRNAVLGRTSTKEEEEFLSSGGGW